MAVFTDREHFIPIRCVELIDVLATDKGVGDVQPMAIEQSKQFRHFARLLMDHYHRTYHARLSALKDSYAPFDPDADTKTIRPFPPEERAAAQKYLFDDFISLLERANYKRMTRAEIEKEMEGSSYWGIDMDVNWDVFDQIELFHRGDAVGHRTKRHWLKIWQKLDIALPTWLRMVLIIKLKKHKRLGRDADTEHVFLKLFKDIPQMDLEMLLPGTRIKMKLTQRGKLGASVVSSIGYVVWKLFQTSAVVLEGGLMALYAPIALVLGYAYKTWSGFTSTRQTYMLQLTQSLYYQNLDNNGGVIFRLLDEAEEQESREAMLAYFYLWRYAIERGWTAEELDDYVEIDLEKKVNIPVDFEIEDALDKLEKLDLLMKDGENKYRVRPIELAITMLEDAQAQPRA